MNIYVGNLPYNVTEDELREAFSEFGKVTSATLIIDKMSGRSKGSGLLKWVITLKLTRQSRR